MAAFRVLVCMAIAIAACAAEPVQVRLQLNYAHQFQFAGFYQAVAKGCYRDEGLEVACNEWTPGSGQLDRLFAGSADFAVYSPAIVKDWGEDRDLFLVAVIQQRCPSALFVRTDSPVTTLAELLKLPKSRVVGPASDSFIDLDLALHASGLNTATAFPRPKDSGDFERFVRGELEVLPGYTTNEPRRLADRGIAVRQLPLTTDSTRSFGDSLVCRGQMWRDRPDLVARFRRASLRGWNLALADPEAAIDTILADHPSAWQPSTREQLRREAAAVVDTMAADLLPVGTIEPARLDAQVERLHAAGFPAAAPRERFFGGMPAREPWLPALAWGLGIALAVAGGLALAVATLRRGARRTDAVFRAMMDSADGFVLFHAVARLDGVLRLTRASASLERLCGLDLKRLQEDPRLILTLVLDDDGQHHIESMLTAVKNRMPLRNRLRIRHPKHHEPRHLLLIATPLPGHDEAEYVGAVIDLTSEAEAEAALREAQRRLEAAQRSESLGLLAGGVAHDFNNLLGAIRGNAEMAVAKLADDDSAKHRVRRVLEATDRAAGLVRQILAYAGKGTIEQRPIDLSAELRLLGELLRHAVAKNVHISVDAAEGLPRVMFDPAQLQQVLVNLIVNAAESYEGRGGTVRIAVRRGECETVMVEVADSGCGMDAATQARMFEPYFTTKKHGHGLGLAAVQGIVRATGGSLSCSSTPGKGTTFTMVLPCGTAPMRAARIDTPLPDQGGALLIADDDELMREMAVSMATELGYTVFSAADGAAAVRLLEDASTHWSAAVLDCVMPDRGGPEIVRDLRARGSRLPVLLISGMVDAGRIGTGILDRRTRFLAKPFSKVLFERTLASMVRPSNTRDDSGAFADLQRESSVHQVIRPLDDAK